VTEYGVAYLHGKSIRQRAEALIGIAHPAFREELYETAARQGWTGDRSLVRV
jgi:acyl-CoA hydrolase